MDDCDNRPVIVEQLKDGEWKPAVRRRDDDSTHVFKCIHEAQSSLLSALAQAYGLASMGIVPFDDLTSLNDYRFVHVDQGATESQEVTSVSDAERLLKEVLSRRPT